MNFLARAKEVTKTERVEFEEMKTNGLTLRERKSKIVRNPRDRVGNAIKAPSGR